MSVTANMQHPDAQIRMSEMGVEFRGGSRHWTIVVARGSYKSLFV